MNVKRTIHNIVYPDNAKTESLTNALLIITFFLFLYFVNYFTYHLYSLITEQSHYS